MTLTPEQIKEAVELADGWEIIGECANTDPIIAIGERPDILSWSPQYLPQWAIAALASQLISQVDAMDGCSVSVSEECATAFHPSGYFQHGYNQHNRDENSILACTEFLREME